MIALSSSTTKEVNIMTTCTVCKNPVDLSLVKEEFGELFSQADALGMESLTENQQVVLERKVCSIECYDRLG
jgi:hypothetical protein